MMHETSHNILIGPAQGDKRDLHHIDELLQQITDVGNSSLAEAQARKESLYRHRMMSALFSVLCELKFELNVPERSEEEPRSQEQHRLENMLLAEGIIQPMFWNFGPPPIAIMDYSYRRQVSYMREIYEQELSRCRLSNGSFMTHAVHLLRDHSRTRPITSSQLQCFDSILRRKCARTQLYLQQWTCEILMILRSRFLDARRKRRNFSKSSVDALNKYFFSHLNNPYPSEEAKSQLAVQCGLSIAQVSNWFGNKRIRYKRYMLHEQPSVVRLTATDKKDEDVKQSTDTTQLIEVTSTSA